MPIDDRSFHFRYFKGFDDVRLALAEPVTLLIGRNGAGKSNLLEGIHLLSEVAGGRPLLEADRIVRGGLDGCPSLGERWFVVGCDRGRLHYEIVLNPGARQVEAERLLWDQRSLYDVADRPANFRQRVLHLRCDPAPGQEPAQSVSETLSSERAVLAGYPHNVSAKLPADLNVDLAEFKEAFSAICVLDPHPDAMRSYQPVGLSLAPRVLSRDGANLSALLYDLHQGSAEHKLLLTEICGQVRMLPEEPFGDLGFQRNTTDEVMLGFFSGPAKDGEAPPLSARLLSDGTLRYLSMLAALETLPAGTLLLLEDFDRGLHSSRAADLMARLWQRCQARRLRALVTTHNPAILNALSVEQLRGVVICYRNPAAGSSRLCPLLDAPDVDLLLDRGRLGDLVTRQVVEKHLLPGLEEQRRAKALSWLDSL